MLPRSARGTLDPRPGVPQPVNPLEGVPVAMAHIRVPPDLPGLVSLMAAYPTTARPLGALMEALMRGPSTLTFGERELIAARVSSGNGCVFCAGSHGAAAAELLGGDKQLVAAVCSNPKAADVTPKMKALLAIADKVRLDGRKVTRAHVKAALDRGATEAEVHQTVLIAAAFCMINRYVDGLGTRRPAPGPAYDEMGHELVAEGYA